MFFTLSLGLGFPYLWLGFFSGGLQRLPKSGLWMVWVKKVFGFVLLGMPLYFLNPLMPEGSVRWVLSAYLMLVGVLLGGVFAGGGVPGGFRAFQKLFGVITSALGVAAFALWPRPVHLPVEPFSPTVLQAAQTAGRPVLLDFSADWCIPCKELELKTFPDARVRQALEGWALVKVDLTDYKDEVSVRTRKGWDVSGVPTLILLGPDGTERARVVGFVGPQDLAPKLERVRPPGR
jgi:thiol:disulfide interchange protein DsbD